MTCAACGEELPGQFPYCPFCGAEVAARPGVPGMKERKVVSVLFCDLVGFTAASEAADPEDVQARLAPYHRRVRERIEVFGGTVEKFIGDAVMAVFGAPVTHEDDPERAVRAGLAILDALRESNEAEPTLGLSVRIGVNTGEAVVTLDARPEVGEGMVTGDVVNTAARIQAQAPVDSVAVGEGTHAATHRVFDYESLEPITAKGKARPVPVWRAVAPRARFGSDVIRSTTTPLVGRHVDVALLRGTFDKVVAERSVQLVTIVGEPGVGKSRLVAELLTHVDGLPLVVSWRQGRCLPYGEGITFWALGEIVKAHAGVYESDTPELAAAKLQEAIPESEDAAWIHARLLPLVGLDAGATATREESFAAWRRFLEAIAEDGPAVLVFEDIHWADEALLAFIEHLADWANDVPLLVVCTARPELYERYPSWGAGLRGLTTVSLAPLSDDDTARLVSALLRRSVLPAETQQLLLERAGGNPLYAEEFVRMLHDRGMVDEHGNLVPNVTVAFPDSLQALIAARLDTLSPDRKALLQDAAVIGKVFWSGAVAAMGQRSDADVDQALHELARKELIRPFRRSSMEDERELGFWHALVRDVAYGQIPRGERAAKHARVVDWLEGKAGERVEDMAEVLAYHTSEAIELATATGDDAAASALMPRARRYALLAGDRALALDTTRALELLSRGLGLTDEADDLYPGLLLRWAQATFQAGDLPAAAAALERAAGRFRLCGDVEGAGRALGHLSTARYYQGDPSALPVAEEAVALLEELQGEPLVDALAGLAGSYLVEDQNARAVGAADRALDLAEASGLPVPAKALGFRGAARSALGDAGGLEDLERAGELLRARGYGRDAVVAANNRASYVYEVEGPDRYVAAMDEVIALAAARGVHTSNLDADRLLGLVEAGRLGEAVREGPAVIVRLGDSSQVSRLSSAGAFLAYALYEIGDRERAVAVVQQALRDRPPGLAPRLAWETDSVAAFVLLAVGDADGARPLVESVETAQPIIGPDAASRLALTTRTVLLFGDVEHAERLCEGLEPAYAMHSAGLVAASAQILEARGDLRGAADAFAAVAAMWGALGARLEQGYALLGRARCLTALTDVDADQSVNDARQLFVEIGATARVNDCDDLLGARAALADGEASHTERAGP